VVPLFPENLRIPYLTLLPIPPEKLLLPLRREREVPACWRREVWRNNLHFVGGQKGKTGSVNRLAVRSRSTRVRAGPTRHRLGVDVAPNGSMGARGRQDPVAGASRVLTSRWDPPGGGTEEAQMCW
jgi:hypothetical protein